VVNIGPTIAVIDDDASVRKALRRLIRSTGLEVEAYASAEEYLSAQGLVSPDCLVLDVQLIGMSGLELQRHLASSDRPVPIVFITAYDDEQAR
jgi:FixJ family two-component response regulator